MKKGKPPDGATEKDPKRQRILDAAFKTFLERGYAGTSTLEIATRAQVSKRELYSYFKDKEDLFAAGIKHRTDVMRVPLASPDLSDRSALARTLTAYGISLLTGVTHPHVLAVHRLAIAESTRAPEVAEILDREGRQANASALKDVMREAQKRGLVDDSTPGELAAEFSSLLFGDVVTRLLMRAIEPPSAKEIARRAQSATETFLRLHETA